MDTTLLEPNSTPEVHLEVRNKNPTFLKINEGLITCPKNIGNIDQSDDIFLNSNKNRYHNYCQCPIKAPKAEEGRLFDRRHDGLSFVEYMKCSAMVQQSGLFGCPDGGTYRSTKPRRNSEHRLPNIDPSSWITVLGITYDQVPETVDLFQEWTFIVDLKISNCTGLLHFRFPTAEVASNAISEYDGKCLTDGTMIRLKQFHDDVF